MEKVLLGFFWVVLVSCQDKFSELPLVLLMKNENSAQQWSEPGKEARDQQHTRMQGCRPGSAPLVEPAAMDGSDRQMALKD
jgi:hypothetical protein